MSRIKEPHIVQGFVKGGDNMSPLFSFDFITTDKRYGFDALDDNGKLALIKRIYDYRKMRWLDIKQNDRRKRGSEKINRVNAPFPLTVKDDVQLLALRYEGHRAMVGF